MVMVLLKYNSLLVSLIDYFNISVTQIDADNGELEIHPEGMVQGRSHRAGRESGSA